MTAACNFPCYNPVLSVVVAIASDTTEPPNVRHLRPCLAALKQQRDPPLMEVIVPLPPGVAGVDKLRGEDPEVRLLEVTDLKTYTGRGNSREHHGELISRGLRLARGSIVALIEDHDIVAPEWSARIVEAHRQPFAGIGGAIENGVDRPLNWAIYFCDFLGYQNPLKEGETARTSDANLAYKRVALEGVRRVWHEEFHEASVNGALTTRGETLALAPGVLVYQHRQGLRLAQALKERFIWGRSFGAWRTKQAGAPHRLLLAVLSPTIPMLVIVRMSLMALQKRRTIGAFLKVFPLIAALTASWACGELTGYLTRQALPSGYRPKGLAGTF